MPEKLIIPDIDEEEEKAPAIDNPAGNPEDDISIDNPTETPVETGDTVGDTAGDIGIDLGEPIEDTEVPTDIPATEPLPEPAAQEIPKEDIDKLQATINKLELSVQNLEFEKKLQSMKDEMLQAVMEQIKPLQRELEDWKERKIPEPREFDTEGAYRENLFTIGCYVLDEILPQLFEAMPEYSLIANTIGKNFEDGTVSDGIISINVSVPKDEYIHDFKVDVPLLNGVALAPQYLSRGLKIIPLTKDAIRQELEYITFQKTKVEDLTNKQNIYSIDGNNRYKRLDTQKQYNVMNQQSQPVGVPNQPSGIPNIRKVEKYY
jgi:hypothetical protein